MGKHTEADIHHQGGLPFSAKGDIISGLTVGFMLVPQSLAFALLAGLPVQIGLYSSFLPLLMYAMLGSIRQVQPGPTALMSLLTGQALDGMGLDSDEDRIKGAALIALLVGALSVILGAVRFGFIVDFMSHCVMAAFCSAAGVTIGSSQLKHLFGIKMERKKYWWQTVSYLVSHLNETDGPTFAIGGTLLFTLLFLKQWKGAGNKEKRSKHWLWRFMPKDKNSGPFKTLKFVADMSSLLAVVIGWLWGWVYRQADVEVKFVGEVEGDGFTFLMPEVLDSMDFSSLLTSAAIMAIVGYLETVAVGGKFAAQARYHYDANQELLALGLANAASGIMSGYPVTGSFSRTAVNAMIGATSLVACAISSILVFLSVYLLLPVIAWLPISSLAPIIIQGAIGVISIHDFKVAWQANKKEFLVMVATFVVSLGLNVKFGLLVGFVLSILKTMHELANPNLVVCGRLPDSSWRDIRNFPKADLLSNAVVVRMDARLSFANARKMKEFCLRAADVWESQTGARFDKIEYIIVDCRAINHVDLTGCEMLERLAEDFEKRGQALILANLKGPAAKCIQMSHAPKVIRKHNGYLCLDMEQALAIISGVDKKGEKSRHCLSMLVEHVDHARKVVKTAHKHKKGEKVENSAPEELCAPKDSAEAERTTL